MAKKVLKVFKTTRAYVKDEEFHQIDTKNLDEFYSEKGYIYFDDKLFEYADIIKFLINLENNASKHAYPDIEDITYSFVEAESDLQEEFGLSLYNFNLDINGKSKGKVKVMSIEELVSKLAVELSSHSTIPENLRTELKRLENIDDAFKATCKDVIKKIQSKTSSQKR